MRTDEIRRSDNVEDMRGHSIGSGGGMRFGVGTVIALVVAYFLGIDPRMVLGVMQASQQVMPDSSPAQSVPTGTPKDAAGDFVAAVLGDTEDTWGEIFRAKGGQYVPPKLVLFSQRIQTGCGNASSGAGPFYCPADQRVYIDLDFYRELDQKFHAPGDFAKAYVLAHEVGHHVQNLLGISDKVRAAQERGSEAQANALSVRLELQADCFAGIWANHADKSRHILESGDVEEALQAASAVGDDTIQRRTQGDVVPETFTHGTAEQRMTWFKRGLDSGELGSCDTFAAR